ncbi:spore coat U domain-containing protein [Kluyvera genomosp. 1]|uniref:Csu type fimbrial protein n=1 Tax=Kluyvera genomosp. 1 TaxID=2774053 RepID=UPI000691FF45|nr:spore coat protein U domain-containing protein [Kluyvera genomosp. 1]
MWLRVLILLIGVFCFPLKSHAVNCSITAVSNVAFSSVNPFSATDTQTSMTFNYSCSKVVGDVLGGYTLCFNLGAQGSNTIATRKMTTTGGGTLNYQLYYKDSSGNSLVWGNQTAGGGTFPTVDINLLNLTTVSGSLTVYGTIPAGQSTVAPGSYNDTYTGATAYVTINGALLLPPGTCSTSTLQTFPFSVTAVVNKQCNINAVNNINLGSVPSTQTNIMGNNYFTMACTNSTPYTIGLSPSNGSSTGSGVLKSQTPALNNADLVPYQLNSTAGINGAAWGNIASTNTVQGTGTGLAVNQTVYAVAPSANYRPDTYADTVTINVTY